MKEIDVVRKKYVKYIFKEEIDIPKVEKYHNFIIEQNENVYELSEQLDKIGTDDLKHKSFKNNGFKSI